MKYETGSSQFPRATFRCLVLSGQQSKTQRYFIDCHLRPEKAANPHILGDSTSKLCVFFAWKMTELITWLLKIIADKFSVNWPISQTQISLRMNINESHYCHKHTHTHAHTHTHTLSFFFVVWVNPTCTMLLLEITTCITPPQEIVPNIITTHSKNAKHCSRQMFWEIISPFF